MKIKLQYNISFVTSYLTDSQFLMVHVTTHDLLLRCIKNARSHPKTCEYRFINCNLGLLQKTFCVLIMFFGAFHDLISVTKSFSQPPLFWDSLLYLIHIKLQLLLTILNNAIFNHISIKQQKYANKIMQRYTFELCMLSWCIHYIWQTMKLNLIILFYCYYYMCWHIYNIMMKITINQLYLLLYEVKVRD